MKVRVASEKCQGHGRCYGTAPDVFHADEEGFAANQDIDIEIPESHRASAMTAVRACPEGAIMIVEE